MFFVAPAIAENKKDKTKQDCYNHENVKKEKHL